MVHRTTKSPAVRAGAKQTPGAATPHLDAPYAILVCGVVAPSAFVSYCNLVVELGDTRTNVDFAMGSIRPEMYNSRNHRCVVFLGCALMAVLMAGLLV